jgi:alkyl hydroperoxide reductase subunit AhpF
VEPVSSPAASARPGRYSVWSLLRARFAGPGYWKPLWSGAQLRDAYDVVIVGAGGHGLATAFHLARDHGIRRVAVLEKRLVGYGNVGRNTTIVHQHQRFADCAPSRGPLR